MDETEAACELTEIQQEIKRLLNKAKNILELQPNKGAYSRALPNWCARIRMELDKDHEFIGGKYSITMQDTIEELDEAKVCEECGYIINESRVMNGHGEGCSMHYCANNDCEQPSCHRCFPLPGCKDHEKCQEFTVACEDDTK